MFPESHKIVVVMDNLNTHQQASLCIACAPEEARSLCERFEFHFTPTHGSWFNMAEIEIGLLARQCLDRRISSPEIIRREVRTYVTQENAHPVPIQSLRV